LWRAPLIEERLKEDLEAIGMLYLSRGHLEISVGPAPISKKGEGLSVEVPIQEGPCYRVGEIQFEGPRSIGDEILEPAIVTKAGEPFDERKLLDDEIALFNLYTDSGHPDVRITSAWEKVDGGVKVLYRIEEGQKREVGGILVTGNIRTKEKTIRRRMTIEKGELFDASRVVESQRRIRDLGVFRSVKVRSLRSPGKVFLIYDLKEADRLTFDVGAGYDTDLGARGHVGISNNNLLGRAKKGALDGTLGEMRRAVSASLIDPHLFGGEIKGHVSSYYDFQIKEAFHEESIGGGCGITRRLPHHLAFSLEATFESTLVGYVRAIGPEAPRAGRERAFILTPTLTYSTVDDLLNPSGGIHASAWTGLATKALGSDDHFVKLGLFFKAYHSVGQAVVFAARSRVDDVQLYGSTREVPATQLLFAGGNATVRGYELDMLGPLDENEYPLGGSSRVLFNLEVRFPIFKALGGVCFLDVGGVGNGVDRVLDHGMRFSVGLGLRYITILGPIRLEYGYRLGPDKGLDQGQYHFALGFPF